ncbi:MAG: 3'-5' exonuclease, partial [Myxococcota bacterium]
PVVFFVGFEEGMMPHRRVVGEGGVPEERRLCDVGITRAQRVLYLTYARARRRRNQVVPRRPSRFADEVAPALLEVRAGSATLSEREQEKLVDAFFAAMEAKLGGSERSLRRSPQLAQAGNTRWPPSRMAMAAPWRGFDTKKPPVFAGGFLVA